MALTIAKPYKNFNQTTEDLRQFSKEIAKELIFGRSGLRDRLSGNATGDWIVYLSHEGKNYYLCIAKHDEDDFILNAINNCITEFPFINDVLF